ncbi:MAG: VWA domain-containing protein, partial [Bacteroidetes bacterium]
MNLSFEYSPFFFLLIVPFAAGLTWLMYRGTRDMLPRWAQVLLTAFRFGALVLIGFLLLEPLLTSLSRLSYPPIIAVLQDQSESLVIQRDSAYVQEAFPENLRSFLDGFDGDEYVVDLYGFANEVSPGLSPDSLTYTQTGTNIAQALQEVQARYQNQNLGAMVLISDGITTAGMNPLYTVEGLKTPLYTVLLGDTTLQRDVRVQEVLFNEIAYWGNEMPIQVKVQCEGFEAAELKVSLRGDGKTLDTRTVSLGRNRPEGTVDFLIKPAEVGLRQYEVIVSQLPNEITYRNNSRRIFINVLETRVKIALFAGAPHPDLGALRKTFDTDDGYELTEFILKEPGVFYEDPGRFNLQDFDLFILHNFPQSRLDQGTVAKLKTVIQDENKPVIYLVGLFTDLATLSPLYEYMALTPRELSPRGEEITLDMQATYRRHSTYTFSDRWLDWINSAPPLYRNLSNWQPRATAEVFATAKIKNVPLDYPVFALQSYLGRKNMVFLGENIWRMRAHSYIETEDFESFDGWLYNI